MSQNQKQIDRLYGGDAHNFQVVTLVTITKVAETCIVFSISMFKFIAEVEGPGRFTMFQCVCVPYFYIEDLT